MANEKNPNQNVQQDQSQDAGRNRPQQSGQSSQGQQGQQGMDRGSHGQHQQDQSQARGTQQGGQRQGEIESGGQRDRKSTGLDKDERELGDM